METGNRQRSVLLFFFTFFAYAPQVFVPSGLKRAAGTGLGTKVIVEVYIYANDLLQERFTVNRFDGYGS